MTLGAAVALPDPAVGGFVTELDSSAAKTLALLTAFSTEHRSMGVSEISRCTGVPKSTAFRLLAPLVSSGLLARSGTRYSVGPRVTELARLANDPERQRLHDIALPYMQDLYEATHETVHLAVLDGADIVYVEKLYGHNRVPAPSRVGGRLLATCSALGKAMLAFGDEKTLWNAMRRLRPRTPYTIMAPATLLNELAVVRSTGVAYDREEAALRVTCVAAPVRALGGDVVAAVSVSGLAGRFEPSSKAVVVQRAAQGIGRALGAHAHRL